MSNNRILILLTLLLFSSTPCIFGEISTETSAVHQPVPYSFRNGRNSAVIPFRLVKGNIYITACIGGGPETDLIFDTGLPAGGIFLFAGSHEGQPDYDTLSLPGITFQNVKLRRTAIDLDVNTKGIFGSDILGSCIVKVDYIGSVIHLYKPGTLIHSEGAHALPLVFFDRSPFIEVDIALAPDSRISAVCCLDLGAATYLHIYSDERHRIDPKGESYPGLLGYGVDGPLYGLWGTVSSLQIGDWKLTGVHTAFSEQRAYPGYEECIFGNIGNRILSRFDIVFDYGNRLVYITPNSKASHTDSLNGPIAFRQIEYTGR